MAVDVRINSFYAEEVLLLKDATILRKSFRLVYTKPEAFLYPVYYGEHDFKNESTMSEILFSFSY